MFQMPKLTSFTLPEVVIPHIAKDPPKSVYTRRKEKVSEADVTYAIRTNDDRICEEIKQYGRGINHGVNLSFTNATQFKRGVEDHRTSAVKLPHHTVPGGTQFRPTIRLEDNFSLSRTPFRWEPWKTCTRRSTPQIAKAPETRPDYKLRETITMYPINAAPSTYPCGTVDQIDTLNYAGVLIKDPLIAEVISSVKLPGGCDDGVDIETIKARMRELTTLNVEAITSGNYTRDNQSYDVPCGMITDSPDIGQIMARPFTLAVYDERSQNITTKHISEREVLHYQAEAAAGKKIDLKEMAPEMAGQIKDKPYFSIVTPATGETIVVVAEERHIPDLKRVVPESNIITTKTGRYTQDGDVDRNPMDTRAVMEHNKNIEGNYSAGQVVHGGGEMNGGSREAFVQRYNKINIQEPSRNAPVMRDSRRGGDIPVLDHFKTSL